VTPISEPSAVGAAADTIPSTVDNNSTVEPSDSERPVSPTQNGANGGSASDDASSSAASQSAIVDGYVVGALGHLVGMVENVDGGHLSIEAASEPQSFILLQPIAEGVVRQVVGRTVRVYYQVRQHNPQDEDHGRTASEIEAYDNAIHVWQLIYRDPQVPIGTN
jgi:hypothetical protein